eukprot:PhF_6_TR41467/c0_g1_i2/m.62871
MSLIDQAAFHYGVPPMTSFPNTSQLPLSRRHLEFLSNEMNTLIEARGQGTPSLDPIDIQRFWWLDEIRKQILTKGLPEFRSPQFDNLDFTELTLPWYLKWHEYWFDRSLKNRKALELHRKLLVTRCWRRWRQQGVATRRRPPQPQPQPPYRSNHPPSTTHQAMDVYICGLPRSEGGAHQRLYLQHTQSTSHRFGLSTRPRTVAESLAQLKDVCDEDLRMSRPQPRHASSASRNTGPTRNYQPSSAVVSCNCIHYDPYKLPIHTQVRCDEFGRVLYM